VLLFAGTGFSGLNFDALSFSRGFLGPDAKCHHRCIDAESSQTLAFLFASSASRRFESSTRRVLLALDEPCIDTSTTHLTFLVASRAPPNRDSGCRLIAGDSCESLNPLG